MPRAGAGGLGASMATSGLVRPTSRGTAIRAGAALIEAAVELREGGGREEGEVGHVAGIRGREQHGRRNRGARSELSCVEPRYLTGGVRRPEVPVLVEG